MTGRVYVACVGNVFLGDDGFGVEVARRLAERELPGSVTVSDVGIRGMHLAFELMDGYETLILVDAAPRGEPAGTVTVLEPSLPLPAVDVSLLDAHGMQPETVLGLLGTLGGHVERVLVVGCEPAVTDDGIGLSPQVAAAVEPAVDLVARLATEAATGTHRERAPR